MSIGIGLSAFLFAMLSSSFTVYNYSDFIVIGNSNSGAAELSKNQFEKIIFGELHRWPNGTKVKIALLKTSHPTGLKVAEDVFDMTPNEFNKYWLSLVFQMKCDAPEMFSSESELAEYVELNSGAIGVISLKASTGKAVKISIKDK